MKTDYDREDDLGLVFSVLLVFSKQAGNNNNNNNNKAIKDGGLPPKNNIRDVGSTADLVLVLLIHLVHWYLVHGLIGTSGAMVPGTLVPTVT